MLSTSEDIKDMLESESSLGLTFQTDLFVGREPSKPDNCVTIFDTPGYPPMLTLGNDSQYYYPSVQIRVRNRDYQDGYALISSIVALLHGKHHEVWNNTHYSVIACVSEPFLLDWQEHNARFVCNFNIQRREV